MIDAQKFNAIISRIKGLLLMEGMIALVGVALFLWGLVLSYTILKTAFFLISGALISYVIVRLFKQNELEIEEKQPNKTKGKNNNIMKKIFFDDFQTPSGQYRIEFINEPDEKVKSKEELKDKQSRIMEEKKTENNVTVVFDLNEFIESGNSTQNQEGGPRAEFNDITKKILSIVKDSHFAYTVALFWVNKEKQQLVLESYITDSEKFITHKRLQIASDLVSQVALSGKPQIVNYVNTLSQADILPYYASSESVKTFVGIPIFYSGTSVQEPVAVLVLDCVESDAYGNETIISLAQVAKLISTLLRSYTSKYDLLLDSEILKSINRLREQLSIDFSVHSITRSLIEETSKLIPWDYISVVLFDDNRKSWMVQNLMNRMNDAYVPVLSELDAQQSIVVNTIQSGIPKIIDNVSELTLPRFYKAERCDSQGALLIVPLNSISRCYGALVVESKDPKTYSESDAKQIQKLTETASWALEILSLTEVMNNYVSLDETTGVLTRKSFMERLHEEVQRANDFSNELSLVMISIDQIEEHISRYGKDAFDFILQSVGRIIKVSVRPYDVVGRFDFNCFVILLINTTSNEASLWAEKIRKNVASNIINIDNKSFSVTISVGVAGAVEEASDVELLENADRVLRKAIEAGGNIIRVY